MTFCIGRIAFVFEYKWQGFLFNVPVYRDLRKFSYKWCLSFGFFSLILLSKNNINKRVDYPIIIRMTINEFAKTSFFMLCNIGSFPTAARSKPHEWDNLIDVEIRKEFVQILRKHTSKGIFESNSERDRVETLN